jgi:hypothetical protein
MLHKLLCAAVIAAGLMFLNPAPAEAHPRGYRYYGPRAYGYYYGPPRVYRPRAYYRAWVYPPGYVYGGPGYYYYYGSPGYYYYGPGVGVVTPHWGLYIR